MNGAKSDLTKVPGVLVAWHNTEDVQSVRVDDSEQLFVDGRLIPLTSAHHGATQQVINYCQLGKRDQRVIRKLWGTL